MFARVLPMLVVASLLLPVSPARAAVGDNSVGMNIHIGRQGPSGRHCWALSFTCHAAGPAGRQGQGAGRDA